MARKGPSIEWKVALCVLHEGKQQYLTEESAGTSSVINASATAMKAKQIWTIEFHDSEAEVAYFKSPTGCYLSKDKSGKVNCSTRDKAPETKFFFYDHLQLEGTCTIRNVVNPGFLGIKLDTLPKAEIHCDHETTKKGDTWLVRLAYHPQFSLKGAGSNKAYAYYNQEANQIHCNQVIPWGQKAQLTLEFRDGQYGIKSFNNKYLHKSGNMVDEAKKDSLFTIHLKHGRNGMAMKECSRRPGMYLTTYTTGKNNVLQAKSESISKEELFLVEQVHPQVSLKAPNGKYVSIKQGQALPTSFVFYFCLFKTSSRIYENVRPEKISAPIRELYFRIS